MRWRRRVGGGTNDYPGDRRCRLEQPLVAAASCALRFRANRWESGFATALPVSAARAVYLQRFRFRFCLAAAQRYSTPKRAPTIVGGGRRRRLRRSKFSGTSRFGLRLSQTFLGATATGDKDLRQGSQLVGVRKIASNVGRNRRCLHWQGDLASGDSRAPDAVSVKSAQLAA